MYPPPAELCSARVEQMMKLLLETKGSFSGTRIGNASVVLRAQAKHLALEANKASSTSQSKEQRRAKLLLLARQALLLKHKNSPTRTIMTDKDWIDIELGRPLEGPTEKRRYNPKTPFT